MSTIPSANVLRRAFRAAGVTGAIYPGVAAFEHDRELVRIWEAIEEQGYPIVPRSELIALRAAVDRVVKHVPSTPWPHRFNGDVGEACREPGCGQMASNGAAH